MAGLVNGADVEEAEEGLKGCFLLETAWHGLPSRRLRDGLCKRSWSFETTKGGDLVHDGAAASRFTKNSHSFLVAAEPMNIVLYPLKRQSLVVKCSIGCSVRLKCGAGKPAKSAKLGYN